MPAGGQLSCSVRQHNTGNVGLTNVTVTTPANAVGCAVAVLEPGTDLVCSAAVTVQQDRFEVGSATIQVEAEAFNRADGTRVVPNAAQHTVTLIQSPSLVVSISLASSQSAVFRETGVCARMSLPCCTSHPLRQRLVLAQLTVVTGRVVVASSRGCMLTAMHQMRLTEGAQRLCQHCAPVHVITLAHEVVHNSGQLLAMRAPATLPGIRVCCLMNGSFKAVAAVTMPREIVSSVQLMCLTLQETPTCW
jgi:hypothetical protein